MKKKGEWEKEPRHVLNNWTALVFSLAERFLSKEILPRNPMQKPMANPDTRKFTKAVITLK